jgi:hypothetical protein
VWNRIRYTFWAPWCDALVAAADFGRARQLVRRTALEITRDEPSAFGGLFHRHSQKAAQAPTDADRRRLTLLARLLSRVVGRG